MSATVGQHLKKAREERYLTLEKAADETRIRIVLLKALESDDYSVMPSAAQGRGFLRNYAKYLGINIDEVIAELQKNPPPPEEISGPLSQDNVLHTGIPSLTDAREDKTSQPFWTSWFARSSKTESVPETESTDSLQVDIAASPLQNEMEGAPADEGTEVKTDEQDQPVESQQAKTAEEAKPSRLSSFLSLFKIRVARAESTTEADESNETTEAIKPAPATSPESPNAIFAEIGRKLRARRELISLTIEEVERHTHLRGGLVRAMEEGSFEELPSPVQTRGMLANYAAFLDLDTDTILLRYADAILARRREKYSETPRDQIQTEVTTSMPLFRSFIAGDLIFGLVMLAIITALAVWGMGRVLSAREADEVQAEAPSIVDVLGGSPIPTSSAEVSSISTSNFLPTTGTGGQAIGEIPTLDINANVVVSIFAVERTYMRISVDGKVAFEGRIAPRETQVYEAENQIEVLTGNAAALRITYNGRDLGLMGNVGEVVSRLYAISGIVTPTSTVPPTPTETPLVTATSTPTHTPTSTPTLTPTEEVAP